MKDYPIAIGHRVVIVPEGTIRNKAAGLIIPAGINERDVARTVRGVIKELGPECFENRTTCWAKVGDRVLFAAGAGFLFIEGEEAYRIINDDDIIARLPEQTDE